MELYDFTIKKIYEAYHRYLKEVFGNMLVHHLMLRDYLRVSSFEKVLKKYSKGKKILEIGAGTGILSIIAAKAGAQKVYAIEETPIIELAKELAIANNVDKKIEFFFENSNNVSLDEKVDIIVAEIYGNDPLLEGVIPYIMDAQKKFLAEDGIIIPYKFEIFCLGVQSEGKHVKYFEHIVKEADTLEDLYQLDFSPYIKKIQELGHLVDTIPQDEFHQKNKILTKEILAQEINFYKIKEAAFSTELDLEIIKNGNLNAIALYFKAYLDSEIVISTSPWHPRTCWEIMIYRLNEPINVKGGEKLSLTVQYSGKLLEGTEIKVNLND